MTYLNDIQKAASLDLPWETFDNCNILVTGASGLIGNCLVDVLMSRPNRSYSVFALGRNIERMTQLYNQYDKEKFFNKLIWDINNPLECSFPFHYIIHAASGATPSDFSSHPVEVMKANLIGLINLMEYGLKHELRRFLYISSGEIYGEGNGTVFTEDFSGYVNPMLSRSCYPSSKRAAETLCSSYISEYHADIVVARPCHIYGPHFTENDNRVYAQFIRNVLRNENIVMKSNGEQCRNWCYVVDCISALLYILFKGKRGEAFNIADESSNITIRQLANMIADYNGCSVITELPSDVEAKGYNPVSKSFFSTQKLSSLGWSISGNMKEKMDRTISEFLKYINGKGF